MTTERRWRACGFVKFSAPELSLDHRTHVIMCSEWMSETHARDSMWRMRHLCKAKDWLFWIEPEGMVLHEWMKYRPMDVRDMEPYREELFNG